MQPVSTRMSSPGRERPLLQHPAGVHEGPAIALQALHDEALAAEQPDAEFALKRDADAHALRRGQERVFLGDELAADLGEVHGHDAAGIGCAEGDAPLLSAAIQEHRHEQRLAGEQALAGAHQGAHESRLLLGSVAEDRLHLDPVVHVHHAAGFGDGGLVRVELHLDVLQVFPDDLVFDFVHPCHSALPLVWLQSVPWILSLKHENPQI